MALLMTRKLTYQLAAVGLFLLLKLSYTQADNDDLAFLLRPTDALVGLAAGSPSVYQPARGYFHPDLNILIDKSCAGFNFWILCFIMLSFLAFRYFHRRKYLVFVLPAALLCAYTLTVFANTSRISIAIFLRDKTGTLSPKHADWLHEAQGIFVYLSCLVAVYLAAEFLLTKLPRPDAQPA